MEGLTVEEVTAAVTAVVLWLTIMDIAVLANVASWTATKRLINLMKEMQSEC